MARKSEEVRVVYVVCERDLDQYITYDEEDNETFTSDLGKAQTYDRVADAEFLVSNNVGVNLIACPLVETITRRLS